MYYWHQIPPKNDEVKFKGARNKKQVKSSFNVMGMIFNPLAYYSSALTSGENRGRQGTSMDAPSSHKLVLKCVQHHDFVYLYYTTSVI